MPMSHAGPICPSVPATKTTGSGLWSLWGNETTLYSLSLIDINQGILAHRAGPVDVQLWHG